MKVYKHGIYDYITIVEIPKKQIKKIDFALCRQPSETLKSFYDRQTEKPDIVMNGGIFNLPDGKTYFNYLDEGQTISGWHWHTAGMGVVDGELKYGALSSEKWTDFVSGYPPLIVEGKKRRSLLAYNADTVFMIAICLPGMKFSEAQDVLLAMGVTHAIALDGGGSTKILHDGKSITSSLYNRAVDNVVAVWLNDIFRVQVGAFSNRIYALAMQTKIRAVRDTIGAGYKNAYVRKIGDYYKVQVGAFSKKESAQRVVDDLKEKGFDAFIAKD